MTPRALRAGFAAVGALAGIAVLGGLGLLAVQAAERVGSSQGYAPEQPIAYSHKIHAGDNHIPCLYCHFAAEKGRHAGIPPLNVCMNCHGRLRVASVEVEKLKEAVAQRRAVRWVKVHNLPDFVYFNHSRHLLAGLACQGCHGPVETMERVRQMAPLTMGWCLDCHRRAGAARAANLARVAKTTANPVPVQAIDRQPVAAATDCSRCHY